MRLSVVVAVISLSLVGFAAADDVRAAIRKPVHIAAQPLGPALQALARERGFQLVYVSDEIASRRTQGAVGSLTTEEALTQLLSGTGMTYRFFGDNGVSIVSLAAAAATASASETNSGGTHSGNQEDSNAQKAPRSFWDRFRVAQVDQGAPASTSAITKKGEQPSANKPIALEEVVVTAQKRNERIQDVPVPVTSISAELLADSNQLRVQEYYTRIPGLTLNYDGIRSGLPTLAIRGIRTSNAGNPTVGIVVDELAYGSSTAIGGGGWVPDIDPSDLARVEVLRGPQGTLYGASSMGGLLKFVTVDPSTTGVTGRLQVGSSSVHNGDGLGYSLRGAVNVPLSDTLAVRASGFARRDPGYIAQPVNGVDGVNQTDVNGGRLSTLWRFSQDFSLKLSALIQDLQARGSSNVNPSLGDLQQSAVRGTGWLNRRFEVYDATLAGTIGHVDLIAVSGYGINSMSDSLDVTPFYRATTQRLFGVTGASFDENVKTRKFTQEVRLSAPIGESLEWLLGAFYANEHSRFLSPQFAVNPPTGARVGFFGNTDSPTTFKEYAGFTDLTWKISARFDLQVGGRYAENRIGASTTSTSATGVQTVSGLDAKDSVFTYLLTPRFRIAPEIMTYARLASGYRAGGVNLQALLPANSDLPRSYKPDKTQNYEVGIKADVLDHTLSLDGSVYYIDWKDIQLALVAPGRTSGFMDNGGRARSQGVELSVESRPLRGLRIAAWVAWNDAKLTENFPGTSTVRGLDGARLPYSSRWSGNISLDQEFPLRASETGFVGASVSYVGDRVGAFRGPAMTSPLPSLPLQDYPAYTKTDLRAGLRYTSWTVDLFVNNVTDKRGVLSGGLGALFPTAFSYVQPRTAGLSLAKAF